MATYLDLLPIEVMDVINKKCHNNEFKEVMKQVISFDKFDLKPAVKDCYCFHNSQTNRGPIYGPEEVYLEPFELPNGIKCELRRAHTGLGQFHIRNELVGWETMEGNYGFDDEYITYEKPVYKTAYISSTLLIKGDWRGFLNMPVNFIGLNKKQLLMLCRQNGVEYTEKTTKTELIRDLMKI